MNWDDIAYLLHFGKLRAERMVVVEVISEKHQISNVIFNR